ncbi:hypothetical protein MAPG_02630 [Magnaporthiopsis poae ATCC 64411]|uniref:Uncharacterized protein n=1 Tax=Magnaporthiopsis poae (strain ATCC 64411 / 73-15) TaxID=644358 RepID=A0A0C4DRW3_MAGP6|nr:hypothetical protein MAPG_02630 [Magnaporthiopsis poae ATCC 64411]
MGVEVVQLLSCHVLSSWGPACVASKEGVVRVTSELSLTSRVILGCALPIRSLNGPCDARRIVDQFADVSRVTLPSIISLSIQSQHWTWAAIIGSCLDAAVELRKRIKQLPSVPFAAPARWAFPLRPRPSLPSEGFLSDAIEPHTGNARCRLCCAAPVNAWKLLD